MTRTTCAVLLGCRTPNIFPGVATCVTGQPAECGGSVFDVFGVSQNFRTPYFFNYNLNVEKSFGNGMAVWQVGYVGSQGRKLAITLNINQLPGGATVVNPVTGQALTNDKFVSTISELRRYEPAQ